MPTAAVTNFERGLILHLRGEIDDLSCASVEGRVPLADDLDLPSMARAALNYLRGNPEPKRGYECKWTLGPLGIPCHCPEAVRPNQYGYDPISLGDTDSRMATQYANMREMAGVAEADEVERGVIARVLGYLREDDYAWINPAAYIGKPIDGLWIGSWTTAKALMLLSETWQRTEDRSAKEQARKIFLALKNLA
ncbi:MAG: hypothetical protein FJ272_20085, partial [Planctomycetes bacterium]|nr:hypothetical protein [Planctomycetota bacterium]